jgi:hypothetical protein
LVVEHAEAAAALDGDLLHLAVAAHQHVDERGAAPAPAPRFLGIVGFLCLLADVAQDLDLQGFDRERIGPMMPAGLRLRSLSQEPGTLTCGGQGLARRLGGIALLAGSRGRTTVRTCCAWAKCHAEREHGEQQLDSHAR